MLTQVENNGIEYKGLTGGDALKQTQIDLDLITNLKSNLENAIDKIDSDIFNNREEVFELKEKLLRIQKNILNLEKEKRGYITDIKNMEIELEHISIMKKNIFNSLPLRNVLKVLEESKCKGNEYE